MSWHNRGGNRAWAEQQLMRLPDAVTWISNPGHHSFDNSHSTDPNTIDRLAYLLELTPLRHATSLAKLAQQNRRRGGHQNKELNTRSPLRQHVVEEKDIIEGEERFSGTRGLGMLKVAGNHTGRQRCGQDELNEPICTSPYLISQAGSNNNN